MESCPNSYKYVLEDMHKGGPPNLSIPKKVGKQISKIEIGDLVMLSVDPNRRSYWPLGRIIEVYPGKDGIVH